MLVTRIRLYTSNHRSRVDQQNQITFFIFKYIIIHIKLCVGMQMCITFLISTLNRENLLVMINLLYLCIMSYRIFIEIGTKVSRLSTCGFETRRFNFSQNDEGDRRYRTESKDQSCRVGRLRTIKSSPSREEDKPRLKS